MKYQWMVAVAAAAGIVQAPSAARAFECPTHFAAAQAAIDNASEGVKHAQDDAMPLVALSHLRHAKMSLVEAKYHHAQPGDSHHARSIIRANEALGHARVAIIVSGSLNND